MIAGYRLWEFEKAGIGVSTVSYNPDFSQDLIFSKICYPKPGKKQTDQLYVPLLILERQWWLQAPGQLPDDQPLDQSVPKIQQWSRDSGHAHHQSVGQSGLIQEFLLGHQIRRFDHPVCYTSTNLHLIDQAASSLVIAAPSLADIEPKIAPTAKEIDIIINGLVKAAPNRIS